MNLLLLGFSADDVGCKRFLEEKVRRSSASDQNNKAKI